MDEEKSTQTERGGEAVTNAEKKAVLLEYQAIERRIKRLQSEKQGWLEKATAVSPNLSDMPKSGGTDKIQNAVCRIADIEADINREIDRQIDLRERIEAAIHAIPDGRLRDLMRYRYMDGKKFEEIAVAMHLDYRWVRRLHGRALSKLTLESPPPPVL